MFRRLGALVPLLLCLWALLVQPTSSSPLAAQVVDTELPNRSVELGPPPALSYSCAGGAVPIDYDQPVCCVNGYVYLNGTPVLGATITISANGESVTVETEQGEDDGRSPDADLAHFGTSLSEEPLNIEPGNEVTITAESDGIVKQRTFIAQSGGQQQDMVLPPSGELSRRADHVMAFDGQGVILFGGLDDYNKLNETWRWDGTSWTIVTPTLLPPSRNKHAMAYDSDRERIVLFGGYQDNGSRFDDTWEWDGSTWANVSPSSTSPEPRTSHAMVYDAANDKIVLFGGYAGENYLNDTWLWDGTAWTEVTPPNNSLSGRANHAMVYDEINQNVVLFGGSDGNAHQSDTWIWDGQTWSEANPTAGTSPSARYQHTMEYDSANGQVVLFGGIDFNQTYLNDTWVWDGTTWTERQPQNSPQARREHAWAYDVERQRLVLFGGYTPSTRLGDTWEWDGNNWELRDAGGEVPPPVDGLPIATINYINPHDAQQGSDSITFRGNGGDGDRTDIIQNYRWTLKGEDEEDDKIISTEANFTLTEHELYDFPVGTHTISFEVQDDEGTWSQPSQQDILIRGGDGDTGEEGTWTHLIYAVADNELDQWMGNNVTNGMLYRLRTAGPQDNVQVGILYDGPGIGDTRRYILAEDGTWTEESWDEPEARMDDMETLRKFIEWGYERFASDYYALSLLDHANGVVGFGQDKSTDQNGHAFLTPLELREALRQATNGRKIEVLHYDGCSFGLLEDAAIAREFAQYVVASPNTGWAVFSYETYRQKAGNLLAPESYARAIAQEYTSGVEGWDYPYTISVFDMVYFEEANSAVSTLGDTLLTYVNGDRETRITQVREIRDASQKYDSGGEITIEIDNEDSYLDIVDFASNLQEQIDDQDVISATAAVKSMIEESFIIYEKHKSGPFDYEYTESTYQANLDNAHGLGIFYPPHSSGSAYDNYINNRLFDTTANSGWTRFLEGGIPAPRDDDPPGLPDDEVLPPLNPSGVEYQLFLPSVLR